MLAALLGRRDRIPVVAGCITLDSYSQVLPLIRCRGFSEQHYHEGGEPSLLRDDQRHTLLVPVQREVEEALGSRCDRHRL
jgi:hypothetical protein